MSFEIRGRGRSGRSERSRDPRTAPASKPEGEKSEERPGHSASRQQAGEVRSLGRGAIFKQGKSEGSNVGRASEAPPERSEVRSLGRGAIFKQGRSESSNVGRAGEAPPGRGEVRTLGRGAIFKRERSEGGDVGRVGETRSERSEHRGGPRGDGRGQGEGDEKRRYRSDEKTESSESVKGAGGDNKASTTQKVGRGRGRHQIEEVIETKPTTCATKKGVTGSTVMLTTNYFDIESMPNWVLYQYQVSFSIDETRERVKRAWIYHHKNTAIKPVYIFDGSHLYTAQRLTNKTPDNLELYTKTRDENTVKIDIKFIQELRRGHGAYLQVFNVLLRRCLSCLDLHLVNRNYFDAMASIPMPQHYLEVWPGYITTIRQHDGGIMMCTNVSHKVMRTDTALHVLKECIDSPDFKRSFQQAMIGAVVLTEYTNKTYQIADVDFDKNPTSTFVSNGREITFVDYYRVKYNINIKDLRQPLLATRKIDKAPKGAPKEQRSNREVLLIPELCRMTGLSTRMLNNKQLMKEMANITRVSPHQRLERLENFNRRLHSSPVVLKDFKDWGLEVSQRLKTVQGRILPSETVQVGGGRTFTTGGRDCDWTVPLRSSPMFSNGELSRWVFITPQRLKDTVERFLPTLKKAADGMHIPLPAPIFMITKTENASEMVDAIERAISMHNPDLIAFGFSNDRQDRYAAVKRKCCVDRGVASQVILLRSMTSKGVMSIATKIAIQIHAKTGGVPWNIPIPSDRCMVVGFDVCHDTFSKSVGAMVASTSPNMTTWYSCVNQHSSKEEISFFLANDIFKAVVKYLERNKVLPGRLIVYRDGVGDGQLGHVIEHEVNALKEKLTQLYGGETWKMAYIVVTKRINTRLFLKGQNPSPGTIVDDDITRPERYDFFLVSQSVRQGTVTPTQYNIISDNIGWSADIMQRFTYKLTHLYYNSSSPVQVPAPCQYAHKLAFLTNQALHSSHHPKLEDKLFFL